METYTQLQFRGRGFPRVLSLREIEQRRNAGKARAAKAGSAVLSAIGKKGYRTAIARNPDFHRVGGLATARLDAYTNWQTGAVGLVAYLLDGGRIKGKQHRYLGSCECCNYRRRHTR